jgi:hypothetical protein
MIREQPDPAVGRKQDAHLVGQKIQGLEVNRKDGIECLVSQQRKRHGGRNQENRTMGQALSDSIHIHYLPITFLLHPNIRKLKQDEGVIREICTS